MTPRNFAPPSRGRRGRVISSNAAQWLACALNLGCGFWSILTARKRARSSFGNGHDLGLKHGREAAGPEARLEALRMLRLAIWQEKRPEA